MPAVLAPSRHPSGSTSQATHDDGYHPHSSGIDGEHQGDGLGFRVWGLRFRV